MLFRYKVYATLSSGEMVFDGEMNYVPRKGEEIEANGYVFVVENVRYILKDGMDYENNVRLQLERIK